MAADLEVLAQNRDALLLAEMAAWLHDMGKCTDEFLYKKNRREYYNNDKNKPIDPYKSILSPTQLDGYSWGFYKDVRYREANHDYALHKILGEDIVKKINREFRLFGNLYSIGELIYFGRPSLIGKVQNVLKKPVEPIEYLARAHAAAHIEKEAIGLIAQDPDNTFLSSPYGHEKITLENLTENLKKLPYAIINSPEDKNWRKTFLANLREAFKNAPGDTERPINEVNLWDWSSIVAALYKAALAGALLGSKPKPNNLKWQLLAVRFDATQIWNTATKIPVFEARKKWLRTGLDNVQKLLEEDYPLGNEIYRDDNGSVFVVPDVSDLLQVKDIKKDKKLKELILDSIDFDGEITVIPEIDFESWWGQNPSGHYNPDEDKTPPIAELLEEKPYSPPDENKVKSWWAEAIQRSQTLNKNNLELCNVSYLRPQGPGKGFRRKMSDYWAEKVTRRAKDWFDDQYKSTIWIDEIADINGIICLITGQFGMMDWLKRDGYLESLFVKPPIQSKNGLSRVPKTPSFARLRRIWETCKTFWDEVDAGFEKTVGDVKKRLKIQTRFKPGRVQELAPYYAYIAWDEKNRVQFSIISGDKEPESFYITENLTCLAKKMGAGDDVQSAVEFIQTKLSREITVYDSEGETRDQPLGTLEIVGFVQDDTSYIPAITLLSDPGRFMALVPANKALKVAQAVKEKYIEEMGKVRNRLPVALSLVFAPSHTPLVTLLDAGRRMLDIPLGEKTWKIGDSKEDGDDYLLQFKENGIEWRFPVKMGDKETQDIWYPYFYLHTDETSAPTKRAFKGAKGWLVHVSELRPNDSVRLQPSYFDFEFLDSSARRFEISYTDDGRRRSAGKATKPYFLENLDQFQSLWELLGRLSQSQIMNINGLIETKRAEWRIGEAKDDDKDEVFRRFVRAVFHNASWKMKVSEEEKDKFIDAAYSGMLNDVITLYHQIMKEKPNETLKEVAR